jgi:NAD(P)-dependent dehydrogenase (short-subunit alcohol dehydrogenase family)
MSHLQLIQEAAPIFKANPDGGVYLISSSIAVRITTPSRVFAKKVYLKGISTMGSSVAYSVTKATGLQLMKNLAFSQGPKIRVNAVLPGLLLTEWVQNSLTQCSLRKDADQYMQGQKFPEQMILGLKSRAAVKQEVRLIVSRSVWSLNSDFGNIDILRSLHRCLRHLGKE